MASIISLNRAALITLAGILLAALPAYGQAPTVSHSLSFPERKNQYLHVDATFPAEVQDLELAMPSWTPGSYKIRDFAGDVENLRARGPDGRELQVRKSAKNRWQIEAAGAPNVTVSYDVWAGDLNVATSWVESDFALLNGPSVFLYDPARRGLPQELTLSLPDEWSGLQVALPPAAAARTFLARDYDELVDSPIIAGNLPVFGFEVDAQAYALVLSSANRLWDGDRASADLARLVKAHQDFWDVNPLEREYLFIHVFNGPRGGLEHDHSTVLMGSGLEMRDSQEYVKWLGLASHEFFHSWNVRRLRPRALARYDYDREMYTRELWLAEGLTSYYDNLLLFRSGLIGVDDYLQLLALEIHAYETMPGRSVRSAERASFDTWIKQYRPDENSINSTVSYYRKGALIGFVTDMAIRRASGNRSSLDDLMRAMYRRFGPQGSEGFGYPPGAFEQQIEALAGPDVRARTEDLLTTTDDPPVDEALQWYGLELERDPERTSAETSGDTPPLGFGVTWETSGQKLIVDQVILGYSGAQAGLLPGDELLAVDGWRTTAADYLSILQRLRPGEDVAATISRRGQLRELTLQVQHEVPESFRILVRERISRRQKERLEAWLGRELKFSGR